MTEKDMIQVRSNITNNVINIQTSLLQRNNNETDYERDEANLEDLDIIIDQLESLFQNNPELVNRILGGTIKSESFQSRVGIGVPLYLHIDVLIGILKQGMKSTPNLDQTKIELISRLERLRKKATNLFFDTTFDPNKQLSNKAIQSIIDSKGEFYFDEANIDGKKYLSVETTHRLMSYDSRNGDIYDSSEEISYRETILLAEDQQELDNKQQQSNLAIIEEARRTIAKYFIGKKIPETMDDFKNSLITVEMDQTQLTFLFGLTDELLKYKINIEEVKKLLRYFKSTEQKEKKEETITVEEHVEPKKGMFERFKGVIGRKPAKSSTKEDIAEFEKARRDQIADDEEVRDVVIFQRKIVNGEEVLIPMNSDEFKVVRR